ncbi:zinc finger protein 106 [Mugil cephalus]|uniref:zinc finger protein 106 n=1 Tax=Mugil cephalus TaxID=48193 RepID=UPI001FB693CB|nr:zinc finger protein 106 [Mugil cephalus]XP_047429121.1 zinc finger protein 106 [Mugil cephalus]
MANTQPPSQRVVKPPVKKKHPRSKKRRTNYCILCRTPYFKHEAQAHLHSMLHHRELETVGKFASHDCQACKASSMRLNEYAQHISTADHKAQLQRLMSSNVVPIPLHKTLDTRTITKILDRNKALKKEAKKKAMKKRKKKQKQNAVQRCAEMLQGATQQRTVASKLLKQAQETHRQNASNHAVFQNKENNVSMLHRHLYRTELAQQNQSGRARWSREPPGPIWPQDQFTQSAHFMRYDQSLPRGGVENYQNGPHNFQGRDLPEQIPWPVFDEYDHRNRQYSSDTARDFTSDHLPEGGAIIFDYHHRQSTGSSQPGQEGCRRLSRPATANESVNAPPVQDVDIGAMLKQIRRALGVREPCRADREARRQNSSTSVRVAACSSAQQPGGEMEQNHITSAQAASSPDVVARAPSSTTPAKPKQTTLNVTQDTTRHAENSSVAADRPSSLTASSQCTDQTTSSEPSLSNTCKVRIAHKSGKVGSEKDSRLNSTLNKLRSLSGARSKLSWKEMYDGMKKKNVKDKPRFGIQAVNRRSDQENSARPQESDLPLSEGFHWESVPDNPSGSGLTLPPPPQDAAHADFHAETDLTDSQMLEALEHPAAVEESCSSQPTAGVSVKVESSLEDETEQIGKGRKRNVSENEPSGRKKKKKKSNKDQDQMDQLLSVSLREEQLSNSLTDLDKSLIQARNALQATYAEVQRLLLLRQQFTTEVNSLRAKRIEILQGMQEGYSGASSAAATTSSAATIQPPSLPSSSAFTSSASQQPPPTTPASSLTQEMCHLPPAGRARDLTDTLHVPLTPPLPMFASNLLPSLLLAPPHFTSTASAADVASPPKGSSASPNTLPPPESSARQQERETQELVISDSGEEMVGNLSKDQAKGKEPVVEKSVPERERIAMVADDKGNESDDSVEMIGSSDLEVIVIDKLDSGGSPEAKPNVPVPPDPPQMSVNVDLSSASTQTYQQCEAADSKIKLSPRTSAESVEYEEPSLGAFLNHTGPVHGLLIHDGLLFTCSADNTARAYNLVTRECQAVYEGHTNKINCLLASSLPNMPTLLFTGSSDQTIRCYNIKSKKCLEQLSLPDRVLCLHAAWNILYVGLASGSVASFDLKTLKELDVFECHGPRAVSCLDTAQEGARRLLLVGSYDSTISVRDAKNGLLLRSLQGHTKTVLCMKVVNDLVFSGSSDTSVHAHNIHTGELVRIYKGHGHAVTSVVILGKVMVTACVDKLVRVYELQSHDRLQVYGGHSDMVMCMAVHKSVIYTGCYDGSVQAVKLNLMKNYRCWWQNCSLIFGMPEHLVQHLTGDHTNANLQMLKCRWRGCSSFFTTQQSIRQELPDHMRSHVESDSEVLP